MILFCSGMKGFAIEASASESGPFEEIVSGEMNDPRSKDCEDIGMETYGATKVIAVRYLKFVVRSAYGDHPALQYMALVGKRKETCIGDSCPALLQLDQIGAKIIQQDVFPDHHPEYFQAENVFTGACDTPDHNQVQQSNYYISPNGFSGVAFTIDLGNLYSIQEILLTNGRNGNFNDRYTYQCYR